MLLNYDSNIYLFCLYAYCIKTSTNSDRKENRHQCVNDTLYECCKKISTLKKSSHKIRKTTISSMIDNGMNPTTIINIVGHKKYSTTLNNYCRERKHKETIKNEFAMATNW